MLNGNEIIFERAETDEEICLQLFMEAVFEAEKQIREIMNRTMPLVLTDEEQEHFQQSKECHICKMGLEEETKVRDHCHFTGKFIGPAHAFCNLKRRQKYSVPIYAHNFSNYDSHFLLQAITEYKDIIPNLKAMCFNTQKFRSISFGIFNFLDSMQFISDSLDKISQEMTRSNWPYEILENSSLYSTDHQKRLLLRKGVFPYEILSSIKAFEDMKEFPPKLAFYSKLKEENISDEDYAHGSEVFKSFKCKNMLEYLKLYNKLDVVLLLEALQSFRNVGYREFKLDPAYFISLPQYGFQW